MTIQEIIEAWNGCCSDGEGGGGSSDLSIAKVTLNLTADDDTPFVGEKVDTAFYLGTSEYRSSNVPAVDHVAEIVMHSNEAEIYYTFGVSEEEILYGNLVDEPVCTGGVEYIDSGIFVVTGDGTITATVSSGGGPK